MSHEIVEFRDSSYNLRRAKESEAKWSFSSEASGNENVVKEYYPAPAAHAWCGIVEIVNQDVTFKCSDGTEMVAVNVRCLDDVDLGQLTPTPFDGKNL